MFLRAVWTLILMALIHCKWQASGVMQYFSKSTAIKKQIHLPVGWPKGDSVFSKLSFLGDLFY